MFAQTRHRGQRYAALAAWRDTSFTGPTGVSQRAEGANQQGTRPQARHCTKKKTLLLKTMQNRLMDVERSVRSRKPIPDPPGIVKAKAKRQELTDLLNDVINELNAGSSQDKMLARAAKEHLQKLPPVKSAAQETVSSLTDKARHAMQAEVKRTP